MIRTRSFTDFSVLRPLSTKLAHVGTKVMLRKHRSCVDSPAKLSMSSYRRFTRMRFACRRSHSTFLLPYGTVPGTEAVALLLNPNNPLAEPIMRDVQDASRTKGLQLHVLKAASETEIETA